MSQNHDPEPVRQRRPDAKTIRSLDRQIVSLLIERAAIVDRSTETVFRERHAERSVVSFYISELGRSGELVARGVLLHQRAQAARGDRDSTGSATG